MTDNKALPSRVFRHAKLLFLLLLIGTLTACIAPAPKPQLLKSPEPLVKKDVYYAGFAYLGQFKLIDDNYPQALRLNQQDNGVGKLERHLMQKVTHLPPNNFSLRFDLADQRKSDENIVLALAIDNEYTSIEVFKDDYTKVIAEVSAQLLFFDFGSATLIANAPVSYAKNHLVRKGADLKAEISALYDEVYLGTHDSDGILGLAATVMRDFDLGQHIKDIRLQVKAIEVQPGPQELLPKDLQLERYAQYLGQYMSAQLSKHYRIAVLPYVRGYAFGNKMPGRFANGDVFTLTLPEPDFGFELSLARFNKQAIDKMFYYVAYANLKFDDPGLNLTYIDDEFKLAVPKLALSSDGLDDWGAYNDAVEELIAKVVRQLGDPQDDWFDIHARNAPESYKNFRKKQELFSEVIRK